MFRRSTKLTSLLVAAASVVSMVPAMAADSKTVDSTDGTIYNAVAYKNGLGYIDGDVKDDDNEGTFYIENGEFKELSDIDTGSEVALAGDKYVDLGDGDNYLDLTSGKVEDEDINDNLKDDAVSALKKKIKKDDDGRFADADEEAEDSEVSTISGNKFAEPWFNVQYHAKKATNGLAANGVINVLTDTKGNYIDADYSLGKIKVVTTSGNADHKDEAKTTIENTDKEYDAAKTYDATDDKMVSGEKALKASVTGAKVIGQDDKYIYRYATVVIDATNGSVIKEVNGKEVDKASALVRNGNKVEMQVIQKISKKQDSDDIDGIKFADDVTCYVIAGDDGKSKDLLALSQNASSDDDKNTLDIEDSFSVVNGKLISFRMNKDNNIKAEAVSLKVKSSFYYVDPTDGGDTDVEKNDNGDLAWDIDVDGNLWALNSGAIKKFDNDEDWDKVYKVDGAMNTLSVYDKDNIIAYEYDGDVYSVIGGKSSDTETPAEPTEPETPVVTPGWAKNEAGQWTLTDQDGTAHAGWYLAPEYGYNYYYFENGVMVANKWIQDVNYGGNYYYFNADGAMVKGWFQDTTGTWYYADESGAMLANTTVDGYVLGATGAWIQ